MKKKIICLMIAGLSLFAYPYKLSAGNTVMGNERKERIIPPVSALMQKKVDAFKEKHPDIFKKNDVSKEEKVSQVKKEFGGLLIISTGALLIILILLILLL
jgi:hypothetical protein